MRKILSLAVAVVLGFAVVGCGEKPKPADSKMDDKKMDDKKMDEKKTEEKK